MEEVSNMPLLDENKNSPIPEPHKLEKKELSVSSLTSGAENIAPQIIFENPTSPKGNISQANSNLTIQTKNDLNTRASEIEVSIGAPDMSSLHDASNGSFLGDAGVSFKSCNDSFLGDVNNSFKSMNGSFAIETSSQKMVAENPVNETITKTPSSLLQPNLNVSHQKSEENANLDVSFGNTSSALLPKDASFTKDQSTHSVQLDSTVVLPLPNSNDNTAQQTVSSTNSMLDNVSNLSSQSISFGDSHMSNDASFPNQENRDASNVFNDSDLGGALAAFSTLKLDDSVAYPLKSHESSFDGIKDVHNSSNLMGFTTMNKDASISDKVSSQVHIQVDSPATVDNINKNIGSQINDVSGNLPETSEGALFDCLNSKGFMVDESPSVTVPKYLEGALCNELFDLKGKGTSPSETESSKNVHEASDAAVCNDHFGLKSIEAEECPSKTESSRNYEALDPAVCNRGDLIDSKDTEAAKSPSKTESSGDHGASDPAVCNHSDPIDAKDTEAAKSPSKTESSGNHGASDSAVCNRSDPLNSKDTEAPKSPSKTESSGNIVEASDDAVCNCSDPFDLKDTEAEKSPKTESIGRVPKAMDVVCSEPVDLKGDKAETSPSKTKELSIKVPEASILCNESLDLEATSAKANPSTNSEKVPEASIDALCNEPFGLKTTEAVGSPVKTEPIGKISEDFDDAISNSPFDLKDAKLETSNFENETFGDALCDDPFNMKSFEDHSSPVHNFVFKVPEIPTNIEDEEFTDAAQFFNPSSFQFLESIKTSSKEEHVPRSSLYIKFDPLHSTFPKNPSGSDVLQALKNENLDTNMQCLNVSARESLGNILISFDSPRKSGGQSSAAPVIVAPAKVYTEEELQQLLNVNELTNQEILLKKQREMEQDLAKKEKALMAKVEEKDTKIALLEKHIGYLKVVLDDLVDVSSSLEGKQKDRLKKSEALEEENTKLKGDVKTLTEDLQSVETTFSDFHKRYEQCKGMLKTFKENEELLKTQLGEQQQAYQVLQDGTREALDKASSEVASVKKTSEAQTAVLKAQLKKSEMKISSLESDMKQIKIENSQLGGICDDLMEKVGKS